MTFLEFDYDALCEGTIVSCFLCVIATFYQYPSKNMSTRSNLRTTALIIHWEWHPHSDIAFELLDLPSP